MKAETEKLHVIPVGVPNKVRKQLERLAKKAGDRALSAYCRRVLTAHVVKETRRE